MMNRGKRIFLLNIPLLAFLLFTLFPIYWTFNTSLKYHEDIMTLPLQYIPKRPTLANYLDLWKNLHIYLYILNSIIVASTTAILVLFLSTLAGYSFARFKFRGKGLTNLIFLSVQMFPIVLLVAPLFIIYRYLRLINTLSSLVITNSAFNLAFCTLAMKGFFLSIPPEIEECAMVDGCSRLGALFRVTLPVVAPGLAATGIHAFLSAWSELLFAVMFISSESKWTLPVSLYTFIGQYRIFWGPMTAGAIVALLPEMILFTYVQKYLVKGLAAGAVKG